MATPDTYTILSMTHPANPTGDFLWTINGTVDGVNVTATSWNSALSPHLASAISFQAFVSPLLFAAYSAQLPPTAQAPPTSSWSQ